MTKSDRIYRYTTKDTNYRFHPLELAEYTRILPELSGIDMTMYVDESSSFKRWEHSMWVVVSNCDPYIDEWMAISVSENPDIIKPQDSHDLEWSDTLFMCLCFVTKFHKILFDISTESVDSDVLYDIMENYEWHRLSYSAIMEIYFGLIHRYRL